jgi:hypothetical protein
VAPPYTKSKKFSQNLEILWERTEKNQHNHMVNYNFRITILYNKNANLFRNGVVFARDRRIISPANATGRLGLLISAGKNYNKMKYPYNRGVGALRRSDAFKG